jgi:DUF971 family protein
LFTKIPCLPATPFVWNFVDWLGLVKQLLKLPKFNPNDESFARTGCTGLVYGISSKIDGFPPFLSLRINQSIMTATPIAIARRDQGIELTWSDGSRRLYSADSLRRACPCALCREKNSAETEKIASSLSLPVLSHAETLPLVVQRMQPVGNYAYNIHFSDGHDSGIYTFELLGQLGQIVS